MTKPNFEALALESRADARASIKRQHEHDPREKEGLSKREVELKEELYETFYVRLARKFAEYTESEIEQNTIEKGINESYCDSKYPETFDKALFVLSCELYTEYPQNKSCALVGMSARNYRDVRTNNEKALMELIEWFIDGDMGSALEKHDNDEMAGLKRVICELEVVGLPCVTEWANNEAIEEHTRAIERAIGDAMAINNSKLWQECNVFEWFALKTQNERTNGED